MLSDEEKKAIEDLKRLKFGLNILNNSLFITKDEVDVVAIEKVLDLIEKQQKEIEELKDMNERQKYRIKLVSEDKIEERGDSIDESTMLKQIKTKLEEKNIPIETLLAEFERLEDLEDDLTTVYLNGVYDGEKKVEDKIKAKIEELEKELEDIELKNINKDEINKTTFYFIQKLKHKIEVLQSLLEKE